MTDPVSEPADPRWRVAHLPLLSAVSVALALCAASAGFLLSGPTAALGAAAGVLVVSLSYTMSTLVIAWADTVRPALIMPLGLGVYVIKYTLLGVVMAGVLAAGWSGMIPMAYGIIAGVVVWTAVQVWWISRTMGPSRRNGSVGAQPPGA